MKKDKIAQEMLNTLLQKKSVSEEDFYQLKKEIENIFQVQISINTSTIQIILEYYNGFRSLDDTFDILHKYFGSYYGKSERMDATGGLIFLGDSTIQKLIPMLKSKNSNIREDISFVLSFFGGEEAAIALIESWNLELSNSRKDTVISYRIEDLLRIGDITFKILDKMLNSFNFIKKVQATYWYGEFLARKSKALYETQQKIICILIENLGDKSEDVRLASVTVLGEIKREKVLEPLISALNDQKEKIRFKVLNLLYLFAKNFLRIKEIYDRFEFHPKISNWEKNIDLLLINKNFENRLIKIYNIDNSQRVRELTRAFLVILRCDLVIPILLKILETENSFSYHKKFLNYLIELNYTDTLYLRNFLIFRLNSSRGYDEEFKEIIRFFGKIGDVDHLLEGFKVPNGNFWFEVMAILESKRIGYKGGDFKVIYNQLSNSNQEKIEQYLKNHITSRNPELSTKAKEFLEDFGKSK